MSDLPSYDILHGNALETLRTHVNAANTLMRRNRRSVWSISTIPYRGAHFATFPVTLVEPCILAGCPLGGIVSDPFSGAGTTGLVALRHGRRYLGIEMKPEYIALARARLEENLAKRR